MKVLPISALVLSCLAWTLALALGPVQGAECGDGAREDSAGAPGEAAPSGKPSGPEAEDRPVPETGAEERPEPGRSLRPRLLILTDIGGDPDDRQSLIRLMVYSNEFEIEGLIASSAGMPGELPEAVTRPDLIRGIVQAYGRVRPALLRRADGWPETEELLKRIRTGNPRRGREFIGEGHDTEASRWIAERVEAGSAELPLNISIWGGQTDLAQALWRVKKERGPDGLGAFVRKFRVYDIADQDEIASWMRGEFPGMFYILSRSPEGHDRREATFRGMYLGGNLTLTSEAWVERRIRSTGPLGALYPIRTATAPNPHGCMKEGDTPSWFFFLPAGGNDPADPSKPGWGGQFVREEDGWFRDAPRTEEHDPRTAVSRWRPAFQKDFAERMAWCLAK